MKYDISDEVWELLKPCLPGQAGQWGGIAQDNRNFINAVIYIIRTGTSWRSLPLDYGNWNTVYRRFVRWCNRNIWDKIFAILVTNSEYEWLKQRGNQKNI